MSDTLGVEERLHAINNEERRSRNGIYKLVMQNDGNLVLYKNETQALWASGTDGRNVDYCRMQNDGNLVLYDFQNPPRPVWESHTRDQPGSFLVVQDDGNLVIYKPLVAIWATNTVQ